MKNSTSDQFKPCPFCGSEKIETEVMGREYAIYRVRCAICKGGTGWHKKKDGACSAWNMRPGAKKPGTQKKKLPAGKSKPAQTRRRK